MAHPERLLFLLAASFPLLASAGDVRFGADAGVGKTDNIERVPDGGHDETITSLGTQFSVLQQSRRLYADVAGDLAWFDYSGNAYKSELVGTVNAATRIQLVESRLSWSLDDSFGQTRRDLFTAPNPLNRENINYASTGPNLQLRMGNQLELLAQARYALISYENSPLDSARKNGLIGVRRQLASTATVGLNLSRERVESRGAASFDDYDHDEAYVRYAGQGARTAMSLDVGASRVDQAGATDSSVLLRMELSRKIGEWSTLSAKAGRVQTDSSGALQTGGKQQIAPVTLDTQSLSQTAAPYVNDYLDLGWTITGRITSLGLRAMWVDENYDGVSLQDRRRTDLAVTATRAIGPRLSARAMWQYSRYNYRNLAGDNNSNAANLAFSWRFGRRLSAEISGDYYRYSSEAIAGNATEQRYWLRLRYRDDTVSR